MTNFAYRAEGLARLSNGLRTPLALIVGYADLLALEPDAGEPRQRARRAVQLEKRSRGVARRARYALAARRMHGR